jgi:hypothetical protein
MADPAPGQALVLIATPVHGGVASSSVTLAYHSTLLSIVRDRHVRVLPCAYGTEPVRARSRLVRQALAETEATHVLWWDADVGPAHGDAASLARLIGRLVSLGEDMVGCLYPKKRIARWGPETHAYDYPLALATDARVDPRGCCEVEGLPGGFLLTSRGCLDRMVSHYREALGFLDVVDGQTAPTVALWQLARVPDEPGGLLLGDDFAFCHRWRAMGGRCVLYVGPDSELCHVGGHVYQGHAEGYCGATHDVGLTDR